MESGLPHNVNRQARMLLRTFLLWTFHQDWSDKKRKAILWNNFPLKSYMFWSLVKIWPFGLEKFWSCESYFVNISLFHEKCPYYSNQTVVSLNVKYCDLYSIEILYWDLSCFGERWWMHLHLSSYSSVLAALIALLCHFISRFNYACLFWPLTAYFNLSVSLHIITIAFT